MDFTVVRDSVILLERKPLPRLHLTTGTTALLECKVTKIVLSFELFLGLAFKYTTMWKGRTMAGDLTRAWHKGNRPVEKVAFLAHRAIPVVNGLKIGGLTTLSLVCIRLY